LRLRIGAIAMSDAVPDKITFSLIVNALDFLQSAVGYVKIKDEHERCIKYGLLHLCDGIELLLKCRLDAEHWSLVVADLDKTSPKDIQSGEFKSVAWQEAIARVEKCIGHEFTKIDKSLFDHLRKLRNRIQHFKFDVSRDECISILAEGLHFATEFIENYLAHEKLGDELADIRKDLTEFREFVELRWKAIQAKVDESTSITCAVSCPRCRQDALIADGDESHCHFCGYKAPGEEAADDWVTEYGDHRSMKDEMISPSIEDCPECARTAFVDVGTMRDSEKGPEYLCFACGACGQYERCSRCDGLFLPSSDDDAVCSDCFDRFMEKD
jgi:hypothetical protein